MPIGKPAENTDIIIIRIEASGAEAYYDDIAEDRGLHSAGIESIELRQGMLIVAATRGAVDRIIAAIAQSKNTPGLAAA